MTTQTSRRVPAAMASVVATKETSSVLVSCLLLALCVFFIVETITVTPLGHVFETWGGSYGIHPATLTLGVGLLLAFWPRKSSRMRQATDLLIWIVATASLSLFAVRQSGADVLDFAIGSELGSRHTSTPTLVSLSALSVTALMRRYLSTQRVALWLTAMVLVLLATAAFVQAERYLMHHPDRVMAGMSLPTAVMILLLSLLAAAGRQTREIFADRRTPRANLAFFTGLAIVVAVSGFAMPHERSVLEATAALGGIVLVILAVIEFLWRPIERVALGHTADRGLLPSSRPLTQRPLDRAHLPAVLAFEARMTFDAPQWARLLYAAVLTGALSSAAIFLDGRSANVAGIWWANVALSYLLLLQPTAAWLAMMAAGAAGIATANLVAGFPPEDTAVLTLVNVAEAGFCAAILRILLPVSLVDRRIKPFSVAPVRIAMMVVGVSLVIMVTGVLAGTYLSYSVGAEMVEVWYNWVVGNMIGTSAGLMIAFGTILRLHMGFGGAHRDILPGPLVRAVVMLAAAGCGLLQHDTRFWINDLADYGLQIVLAAALLHPTLVAAGTTMLAASATYFLMIGLPAGNAVDTRPELALLLGCLGVLFAAVVKQRYLSRVSALIALANEAPSLLATCDADMRLVTVSERLAAFVGRPSRTLKGMDLTNADFVRLQGADSQSVRDVIGHGGAKRYSLQGDMQRHDGVRVPIIAELRRHRSPGLAFAYSIQFTDISRRTSAIAFANALLTKTDAILMVQGPDYRIRSVTDAWCALTGFTREEVIGCDPLDFSTERCRAEILAARQSDQYLDGGSAILRREMLSKDGALIIFQARCVMETVDGEQIFIINMTDITDLERKHSRRLQILEDSPAATVVQDMNCRIISVSAGFRRMTGYASEDLLGYELAAFIPEDDHSKLKDFGGAPIRMGDTLTVTHRIVTKSGDILTMRRDALVSRDHVSGALIVVSALTDIGAELEANRRLEELAKRDPLTNLSSRRALADIVARRSGAMCIATFDIDRFKSVNDIFGHETGDRLLCAVAEALSRVVPQDGHLLRMGGEEFAMIVPWRSWTAARSLGDTIRETVESVQIPRPGGSLSRTASMGVAKWQPDCDIDSALANADAALLAAKSDGRNCTVLADPQFLAANQRERVSRSAVEQALVNHEIVYHLQPIWDQQRQRVAGFEALLRWERADGTVHPPSDFLEHFLDLTARKEWFDYPFEALQATLPGLCAFPGAFVSMNFRLENLAFDGAAQAIIERLTAVRRDRPVVIEISETAVDERLDFDALLRELAILEAAGLQIALDDFGKDASNLDRLLQLSIRWLKLDRSLVSNVANCGKSRALIRHLASMCDAMQVDVIAEGVERPEQAVELLRAGIAMQQGFLHARPMSLLTLDAWRADREADRLQLAIGA